MLGSVFKSKLSHGVQRQLLPFLEIFAVIGGANSFTFAKLDADGRGRVGPHSVGNDFSFGDEGFFNDVNVAEKNELNFTEKDGTNASVLLGQFDAILMPLLVREEVRKGENASEEWYAKRPRYGETESLPLCGIGAVKPHGQGSRDPNQQI